MNPRRIVAGFTIVIALGFQALDSNQQASPLGTRVVYAAAQAPAQYLVQFTSGRVPDDFDANVASLGGKTVARVPEIGVAVVGGLTETAAGSLRARKDVADVTEDPRELRATDGLARPAVARMPAEAHSVQAEHSPYFPLQWNMRVTEADRVWRAGVTGSEDVRIAIIDTGIDPRHPDLLGRIDEARSTSFCPDEAALIANELPGYPAWTDLYGHGTFVASIAASNGYLAGGVSSRSTLMAVKWDGIIRCGGSAILRSVIYAADNGADVINMSLASVAPNPKPGQRGFHHYTHLAIQYALVKGVSAVVVAAGNSASDIDHNRSGYQYLCDSPGVICVSATGPLSAGPAFEGPFVDVDAPAFYTNYGASAIDVAAPGGNLAFDAGGNLVGEGWIWGACATTDREILPNGDVVPGFCSRNGLLVGPWLGTSFAAPHVAGLAALLVDELGHGQAAQVTAVIRSSADDRGKPGTDPIYGRGRINIARALNVR